MGKADDVKSINILPRKEIIAKIQRQDGVIKCPNFRTSLCYIHGAFHFQPENSDKKYEMLNSVRALRLFVCRDKIKRRSFMEILK